MFDLIIYYIKAAFKEDDFFIYLFKKTSFPFQQICSLYCHHNKNEANLRQQLAALKAQLKEINMMDQFAKHAKVQRKINKIQDELSDKSRCDLDFRASFCNHH